MTICTMTKIPLTVPGITELRPRQALPLLPASRSYSTMLWPKANVAMKTDTRKIQQIYWPRGIPPSRDSLSKKDHEKLIEWKVFPVSKGAWEAARMPLLENFSRYSDISNSRWQHAWKVLVWISLGPTGFPTGEMMTVAGWDRFTSEIWNCQRNVGLLKWM